MRSARILPAPVVIPKVGSTKCCVASRTPLRLRWNAGVFLIARRGNQADEQIASSGSFPSAGSRETRNASRQEAEAQLKPHRQTGVIQSDFIATGLCQRRLPARLQLPAPPAVRFHPLDAAPRREAEVHLPSALPRHFRSSPAHSSITRGARYQVTRVMMPIQEACTGDLPTSKLIVCSACGYLHPVLTEPGPSNCERCETGVQAKDIWSNMFRQQNVVTRRR